MPQMAPILWLYLYFIFTIVFIMFNILNYFNYDQKFSSQINNMEKKSNTINWKW
uniref:ATP synthase complex subunit 8 n=1 Tax=Pericoma sp. ZHK-2021 TaxID=2905160 RepID=A0A8K1XVP0_9DIPT|nr:ATP synthase F0 subunit 8 [Pericoma sp. ZHK-2021]